MDMGLLKKHWSLSALWKWPYWFWSQGVITTWRCAQRWRSAADHLQTALTLRRSEMLLINDISALQVLCFCIDHSLCLLFSLLWKWSHELTAGSLTELTKSLAWHLGAFWPFKSSYLLCTVSSLAILRFFRCFFPICDDLFCRNWCESFLKCDQNSKTCSTDVSLNHLVLFTRLTLELIAESN